ncbi:MAG: acetoacetate decarboxylase family protein [Polyangiales bacterium]
MHRYVYLAGDGIFRGATLELPQAQVRALLPHGLTLGAQQLTRPGTHPVIMLCNEILRAHMTVPSALPSLSYRELSLGIPHCYLGAAGPFYYQPRLWLDDGLAMLGGVLYWGLTKRLAHIAVDAERFAVAQAGRALTSLQFTACGDALPVRAYPRFAALRALHQQPLVMTLPLGLGGPFFVCADFDKAWEAGTLQPLRTHARIDISYLPGLPTGAFDAEGIDACALGSYELRLPWRLSLPYPPALTRSSQAAPSR